MGDRQFTEKQTARILRRAAELQAADGKSDGPEGLSVTEVIRVGSEVGLDEQHVRAAMEELAVGVEEDAQTRWLGAPPSHEVERIIPGGLPEDGWQAMVGELNATFKQSIPGLACGPVRSWHWKHELGNVHVDATEGAGSTRVRIVAYIDDGLSVGLMVAIFAMLVSVGLLGFASDLPQFIGVPFSAIAVLLIAGSYRRTASRWFRSDRKKLAKLMDRLEEAAKVEGRPSPAVSTEASELRQNLTG